MKDEKFESLFNLIKLTNKRIDVVQDGIEKAMKTDIAILELQSTSFKLHDNNIKNILGMMEKTL